MSDPSTNGTDSPEFRRLRVTEDEVRSYVEELWIPYHRELSEMVGEYSLAEDVDVLEAEVEHRLEWLEEEVAEIWTVHTGETASSGTVTGETSRERVSDAVGFVAVQVSEAPSVFDHPDRLIVRDLYVRPAHRGDGLGRRLLERAAETASHRGCSEITLHVDEANEAAKSFYDSLGFETKRRELRIDTDSC